MENKNITVKQLISKLQKYPEHMEVWLITEETPFNTHYNNLMVKEFFNEWNDLYCVGIKSKIKLYNNK